jgi:hypothetical protein
VNLFVFAQVQTNKFPTPRAWYRCSQNEIIATEYFSGAARLRFQGRWYDLNQTTYERKGNRYTNGFITWINNYPISSNLYDETKADRIYDV